MSDAGKVIFSGENPGLTLYAPGSDTIVAAASYWRCVYSPHGEGNALLIWADPTGSGLGALAPHAIYTDNPGVGRLVADRFNQHFATFKPQNWPNVPTTHARFFQESDSRWYHRVACNTGQSVVELVWWDVLDYQMRYRQDYQLGPTKWELHTVICPCGGASITVNNHKAAGEVRVNREASPVNSSCFLAFSETWIELG